MVITEKTKLVRYDVWKICTDCMVITTNAHECIAYKGRAIKAKQRYDKKANTKKENNKRLNEGFKKSQKETGVVNAQEEKTTDNEVQTPQPKKIRKMEQCPDCKKINNLDLHNSLGCKTSKNLGYIIAGITSGETGKNV